MYRTKQREELLEYMASRAGEHITVSDICEHFKKSSKPIGTATVYRQLEKMVDQGIVTKYNIDAGTPACFEYIAQDSDHRDDGSCYHCKCEKCGRLIHLHCADVKELEKHLGKAPRNGEYLEIWHAFNEIDALFGYVDHCFSSNQALLSSYRKGLVTDGIINNWSDGVRITRERTGELSQKLEATLGKVYPMPELREFIEERFMSMLEINEKWGEILRETASKPHL